MPEVSNAVFLSYASDDAEAAERIATALRAAGVEVWFDQSELRGGDTWDRQIRERIHDCRLFIALISAHTEARDEGYFRHEWKLAVERTHHMADKKPFLVPVVIDDTRERGASVPDKLHEVQWTRLPGGEMPPAFVARIQKLLVPDAATRAAVPTPAGSTVARAAKRSLHPNWPSNAVLWVISALVAAGLGYLIAESVWRPQHPQASPALQNTASSTRAAPATAFNPPPHSIAVLPFVNLSGDKEQEYFSDGLTEELLNSLAQINDLQVAARTSSFSFREHPDIVTVAHKLNVAAVLEGSVRRSEHTMRVTAQLINAVTGFHLWSKTYDRDIGDVLRLQTEIATAVAEGLKVTLLGDIAQKIELGGTRNPAALDAYLRASKAFQSRHEGKDIPTAIAAYTEAIRLDSNFAIAFAGRSIARTNYAAQTATGTAIREGFEKAERDARQAIALAPELAEAHAALAYAFELGTLDFTRASEEYQRALALAPGNAQVLRESGEFAAFMGHFEAGIATTRRAVVLDPLAGDSHYSLGHALYFARRYEASTTAFAEAISLNPDFKLAHGQRGRAFYVAGDLEKARASCEVKRDDWASQWCLAMVYEKVGRRADAEAELSKMKSALGDALAIQYATIYAQWGDRSKALEWLETAMRLRDSGLEGLKTDPLFDPLRQEPRFQAVMRELRFPD
jgi:TolB-like protein/Tfp pilus assembly protein PilF